MRARRGGALLAWAALTACTGDPTTRVVVIAGADRPVLERTDAVRIRVLPGSSGEAQAYEETRDVDQLSWPIETTIVPRDGDARRMFRLELAALDAAGAEVVVARATTGFVEGETRVLRMQLERVCLHVECGENRTCESGRCVTAQIDPDTLPAFVADASVASDGGAPSELDAGVDACTPATSYADEDGDGYGDPATLTITCAVAPGRVTRGEDCDDACADCTPAGVERCDGARDEDCDGTADEGCACTIGASRACPDGTDAGECVAGAQTCVDGTWGACAGRVDPVPEDCDGVDDDCDGRVDEGLRRACGTDLGACTSGFETCAAGAWGSCTATGPAAETCNAIDDDCDGLVDELVETTFYRDADADGFGNPSVTTSGCAPDAGWVSVAGDCNDACRTCRPGGTEVCDGRLDENCSMGVDEGCMCVTGTTRACPGGVDTGECSTGTQTCTGGSWGSCTGAVGPTAETCDGLDDDCDARVDEALVQSCGPTVEIGMCRRGTQTCSAGTWGTCSGAIYPSAETCNAIDDDCDASVDEGVLSTFYLDADADGYGTASSTRQACTRPTGYAARSGDCDDTRATVSPAARETCNGIDDDCDARVDDGITCALDAGPRDAGPADAGVGSVPDADPSDGG